MAAWTGNTAKKLFPEKTSFSVDDVPAAPRAKYTSPKVVSIKVENLRKIGYKNLDDWLSNSNNVYIGRKNFNVGIKQSKWNNPYHVAQYGLEGCLERYKKYMASNKDLLDSLDDLNGKTLGCWCKPAQCHGDILVELFNERFLENDQ